MKINQVKDTARAIRPMAFGAHFGYFVYAGEWQLVLMILFLYTVALLTDL